MSAWDYDEAPGWPAEPTSVRQDTTRLLADPDYERAVRVRRIRRLNGWFEPGKNSSSKGAA